MATQEQKAKLINAVLAEAPAAEETVVVGDRVESAAPDINGTVSTGTVVAITDTALSVRVDGAEVSTTPRQHKAWRKLPLRADHGVDDEDVARPAALGRPVAVASQMREARG